MTKTGYLPRAENEQMVWFNNFAGKFAVEAAALGFTATDIAAVNNDAAMFAYIVNQVEANNAFKQKVTQYKELIKNGPIGAVGSAAPVAPAAAVAPTVVLPGILPRISMLVQRIKVSPAYTEAIGRNLGIIGQESIANSSAMKPVLNLSLKGGRVELKWTKGDSDALYIESDKGTGSWSFKAVASIPHFADTTPVTTPAVWRYRAIYLVADEKVGQWSDVASITVG